MLGQVMSGHSPLRMEDRRRRWRLGIGMLEHAIKWAVLIYLVVGSLGFALSVPIWGVDISVPNRPVLKFVVFPSVLALP